MATSIPLPDSKELTAWRHDFHQHPETAFEEQRTSARIAALLGEWGFEVTTGIAGTGVVAALDGQQGEGKTIGLRADIDALDIREETGLAYASQTPGMPARHCLLVMPCRMSQISPILHTTSGYEL